MEQMNRFIEPLVEFFAMRDWSMIADVAIGITVGLTAWATLKWLGSLFTMELPSGSYKIGEYVKLRRAHRLPRVHRMPIRSEKMADLNGWSFDSGKGHVTVMKQ